MNKEELFKKHNEMLEKGKKETEKQFNENMSKLITPSINIESNLNSENDKYVSKVSDPYKPRPYRPSEEIRRGQQVRRCCRS